MPHSQGSMEMAGWLLRGDNTSFKDRLSCYPLHTEAFFIMEIHLQQPLLKKLRGSMKNFVAA